MCERFGDDTYVVGDCEELLERNHRRWSNSSRRDPRGRTGQLRGLHLRRRAWATARTRSTARCGARATRVILDFAGTDPQSDRLDQLLPQRKHVQDVLRHLHDHGVRPADPVQRRLLRPDRRAHPRRSLLKPKLPAALSGRTHALGRIFDMLGGLLGQKTPEFLNAAGFSSSPAPLLFGLRPRAASGSSCSRSASAAFPAGRCGDGPDGHSLWPASPTCRTSFSKRYFPAAHRTLRDRSRIRAAPGCTAAATASTSSTASWSPA